jgi:hypothetical protein
VESRAVAEGSGDGLALEGGAPVDVSVGTVHAVSSTTAAPSRTIDKSRARHCGNRCEIVRGAFAITYPAPAPSEQPMLPPRPKAAACHLARQCA